MIYRLLPQFEACSNCLQLTVTVNSFLSLFTYNYHRLQLSLTVYNLMSLFTAIYHCLLLLVSWVLRMGKDDQKDVIVKTCLCRKGVSIARQSNKHDDNIVFT